MIGKGDSGRWSDSADGGLMFLENMQGWQGRGVTRRRVVVSPTDCRNPWSPVETRTAVLPAHPHHTQPTTNKNYTLY